MARTWSYRKRDITINEVKPKGIPPVVYAYLFLISAIMLIVFGTAISYISHPIRDAVVMGMKSDSYQTETPRPGNAPTITETSKSDDGPTVIDVH